MGPQEFGCRISIAALLCTNVMFFVLAIHGLDSNSRQQFDLVIHESWPIKRYLQYETEAIQVCSSRIGFCCAVLFSASSAWVRTWSATSRSLDFTTDTSPPNVIANC